MAKHFYDAFIPHKNHDTTRSSAHGLFSMADQMKIPDKPKIAAKDEKKCCFMKEAIEFLTRH